MHCVYTRDEKEEKKRSHIHIFGYIHFLKLKIQQYGNIVFCMKKRSRNERIRLYYSALFTSITFIRYQGLCAVRIFRNYPQSHYIHSVLHVYAYRFTLGNILLHLYVRVRKNMLQKYRTLGKIVWLYQQDVYDWRHFG